MSMSSTTMRTTTFGGAGTTTTRMLVLVSSGSRWWCCCCSNVCILRCRRFRGLREAGLHEHIGQRSNRWRQFGSILTVLVVAFLVLCLILDHSCGTGVGERAIGEGSHQFVRRTRRVHAIFVLAVFGLDLSIIVANTTEARLGLRVLLAMLWTKKSFHQTTGIGSRRISLFPSIQRSSVHAHLVTLFVCTTTLALLIRRTGGGQLGVHHLRQQIFVGGEWHGWCDDGRRDVVEVFLPMEGAASVSSKRHARYVCTGHTDRGTTTLLQPLCLRIDFTAKHLLGIERLRGQFRWNVFDLHRCLVNHLRLDILGTVHHHHARASVVSNQQQVIVFAVSSCRQVHLTAKGWQGVH